MTTTAAVLVEQNKPLEIMDLELPELKKGQVLVKVEYSGICRTQVNEILGLKGPDRFLPHTLGHEGSGVVLSTGEGVTKVSVGDHVILTWIKGSGLEQPATAYRIGEKIVNSGSISTFLTNTVISENRLIPIPKTISLKEAALFGCAVPTGAGIVYNQCDINPESTVAVFGMGGIGSSVVIALKVKQPKRIIAIDTQENKREWAHKLGADTFINPLQDDLRATIMELTDGKGVDLAIEAAGVKKVMEDAFELTANHGKCVIAGNPPKGQKIEVDPFAFISGKQLIGSWGGGVQPDRDIPKFLHEFEGVKSTLNEMITHEAPLVEINDLISLLRDGKVIRAMVKVS